MARRGTRKRPAEHPGGLDARFCALMDAAPVMIWVSGRTSGCVWFNQPWLAFRGRSMVQELDSGWTEGVHRDDLNRCLATYGSHFDARKTYRMHYRLRHHDGTYHWIDDSGIPRYGRDGTFLGYIGSCADVTEAQETETELRDGELGLRLALEAARIGTFESDTTSSEATIDDQAARLLGLQEGTRAVSVAKLCQCAHSANFRAANAKKTTGRRKGNAYQREFRVCLPGNGERWLAVHAVTKANRIFGLTVDITERKALEREAAELACRVIALQEEERQRIAQDLHDSTVQHLVATSLNLMTLRPKAGMERSKDKLWDEVENSVAAALSEIRTLSYVMHPLGLDADGLSATLSRYIDGYVSRSGLPVRVRSTPKADSIPLQVQRSLFRIVQEALANVHRHARATRASVEVRALRGRLHVIVSDNGRGADNAHDGIAIRRGVGTYGIKARAHELGGFVRIQTGRSGTKIHVVVGMASFANNREPSAADCAK